jgi:hypothetical protein
MGICLNLLIPKKLTLPPLKDYMETQQLLSSAQLQEFYHSNFVEDQVAAYLDLIGLQTENVVDIGGGCGYFAESLTAVLPQVTIRVMEMDRESIEQCAKRGIRASYGDALSPPISGDESVVCFNLILHHLVSTTESETENLQTKALHAWRDARCQVFVHEYIYDSFLGDASAKLIYAITSSSLLSRLAGVVAKVLPSLRANTFGIGVRFRSKASWENLFERANFTVVRYARGADEPVALARRLLLIKSCRRDTFVLSSTSDPLVSAWSR